MAPRSGGVRTNKAIGILVVNGGRDSRVRRWIELCVTSVERHSDTSQYRLYVWNNNVNDREAEEFLLRRPDIRLLRADPDEPLAHFHAVPLQRLYESARHDGIQYVVTMDSDAFPVRDGWLEVLVGAVRDGAALAGVWRDELAPGIEPYVHASCLCTSVSFVEQNGLRFDGVCNPQATGALDTLYDFSASASANGRPLFKLRRSNKRNFHRLMGGLYGDLVYHHGAGSRSAILFWGERDSRRARELNTVIAKRSAFLLMTAQSDYIGWLRGETVSAGFPGKIGKLETFALSPDSAYSRWAIWLERLRDRFARAY